MTVAPWRGRLSFALNRASLANALGPGVGSPASPKFMTANAEVDK